MSTTALALATNTINLKVNYYFGFFLCIAPQTGQHALGTEMLKVLVDESRKAGLTILVLHVFSNNQHARRVYEKVGFKETGRIPKGLYRHGTFIDDVIMVKELE